MTITEFQQRIRAIYHERDSARGVDATFRWLIEEIGELARALRDDADSPSAATRASLEREFADVLAWLTTLASLEGVDLERAATKQYANGCPKCESTPCTCGAAAPRGS